MIIEETETYPGLNRVVTVKTSRGHEFVINVDKALEEVAELFSDLDNEKRGGWQLHATWYEAALTKLRAAAIERK